MGLGPILMVLAMLLFLLAAFLWPPAIEPYRVRMIAAGLMCWTLSLLVGGARLLKFAASLWCGI